MKTRDWKTGIRVQKGVVRIVMHKIGCFTSKTYFYIFLVFLRTPGTQEILIIPENAKNLKEVSPSSLSFRGPPPFNLSSFGVKKIKMKKKKRRGASSRDFVARWYSDYLATNFSKQQRQSLMNTCEKQQTSVCSDGLVGSGVNLRWQNWDETRLLSSLLTYPQRIELGKAKGT